MNDLATIFAPDFLLRNSLYAGVVVGFACPLIGLYFVLRRMIFLGVALPQVSGAGIALAFLLHGVGVHFLPHVTEEHWMALGGSLALTAAVIVLLVTLERRRVGTTEGRIGVTYVLASASAILLVAANPHGEAHVLSLLKGEIVAVSDESLHLVLLGYGMVVLALAACHRELLLVSYDREAAITLGRRVAVWDVILFGLIGLTISLGVMTVGPLVVFAFLVIPPLAALRLVRGMVHLAATAAAIGLVSSLAGFYLSYRFDLPLGPTDAVVVAAMFGGSLVVKHVVSAMRRPRARYSSIGKTR
jgi:ABC-type Mn2+/Zn2+ transport system permease subunit